MSFGEKLKALRKAQHLTQEELASRCGIAKQNISRYEKSSRQPSIKTAKTIADALGVTLEDLAAGVSSSGPSVTEDVVPISILGEVAAGFDHFAVPDLESGAVDVPRAWLKGRPAEDFFVLRVCGESMFPLYQEGDLVVVLRQSTMNFSGEIGVVLYDDDKATLKRIEFVAGEDWMRLSPVNPQFPPVTVRGEALEHCRVLGVPRMLIRSL